MKQLTEHATAKLDYGHLAHAYDIADQGQRKTFPNPVVGAVIAKGERVISTGYHRRAGKAHAEALVIEDAATALGSTQLNDTTLYVTLEPCSYDGKDKRTPPCVSLILKFGIPRVVIGAIDPNKRENGRGIEFLRHHGVDVVRIDMQPRFTRQNEGYVVRMRHGRPLIELKLAQTVDGYSADSFNRSQWISDRGALRFAHHLRAQHDAILIGAKTALLDDPRLSARFGMDYDPTRIVLDRELKLPLSLKIFQTARTVATYVVHDRRVADDDAKAHSDSRADDRSDNARQLDRIGVRRIALDTHANDVYAQLFSYLNTHTICNSVLIEGGAETVGRVIESGVWDKISLVISPALLMGGRHIRSKQQQSISHIRNIDAATWQPLTRFDSQCMVLRGYRDCADSFGIPSAMYNGDWNV